MHIHKPDKLDLEAIIASIEEMDDRELVQVQSALDRRCSVPKQSAVLQRYGYRHGVLQLEGRAYRRKDGEQTERGPYWYFHYREGGRQRTIYLGKTDNPETIVDEKLGREE